MLLTDSVKLLNGVGPKIANNLSQLGIYSIENLLFHLPLRYQNKTKIAKLSTTNINKEILVQLQIESCRIVFARKPNLLCNLFDDLGQILTIRFFNFNNSQKEALKRGEIIQCFGELKLGKNGFEMIHPEYRIISQRQKPLLEKNLSPIYPTTLGIRQNSLKYWIKIAIEISKKQNIEDFFTFDANWSVQNSIEYLHNPPINADIELIAEFKHPAQQRLILEEFCANQLSLLKLKEKRKKQKSIAFLNDKTLIENLKQSLNFKLTNAQKKAVNEITTDLKKNEPMLRLLQGDVGCGKTIVAVIASLQAIESNYQVAIMAPTEILAEQHLYSFRQYLTPLEVNVCYLTGSQSAKDKKENLSLIKQGKALIAIGTHSLIQKEVEFNNLGLVIIDEQHRFGVHQRLSLTQKAKYTPHQLVMTATPIPRSLAMTYYADLDTSIIDELPPLRKKVKTAIINISKKDKVINKIANFCAAKKQVYWVCTLIEESESLQVQAAINAYDELQNKLKNHNVALIHGKLNKDEKNKIMNKFYEGEIDILIATTVIEVGVDVPNANLMIIENAERLGLSQLHQLRGRVGRGSNESVCILMYKPPLSNNARERLDILRLTNDGFKIAQKDLQLRGPGEILNTKQTGIQKMKIADINRDNYLIDNANEISKSLLQLPVSKQQRLISRWINEGNFEYASA